MPYKLPLTADGERTFICQLGDESYRFRTYFADGWLMDIYDLEENLLAGGVRILPGSPNVLKGRGDLFNGVQVVATLEYGKADATDALGAYLNLIWFTEGEESPFTVGDPMDNIGKTFEIVTDG